MGYEQNKKFKIKEPVNALTHFLGFLMSIPILILLITKAHKEASFVAIIAF